jgi:membrane protein DedA with SNARE-associated domain
MDYLAAQLLGVIKANPEWATLVVGLTAFAESFVFLGLLFPGTTILIAAGVLVSEGILKPLPTIAAGIVGAALGDMVSFWLGRKFGPLLSQKWPLRSHPERLASGVRFFARYGVASIFIGRFFGPLRAVVPLVAGMMEMPRLPFYAANILSAVIWAMVLVVFGNLLTRWLGHESLTMKILFIAIITIAVVAFATWAQRKLL